MTIRMGRPEFEELVGQALDELPDRFSELLENVAVVVEEEPTAEELEALGLDPELDDLFGLYQGVPMSERDSYYGAMPDRVVIYRLPILHAVASRREVIREVRDTLVHELGHYFGLEEDEMPY